MQDKHEIRTTVSRLLAAVPVHLPMILSMHFLWMAALHSDKDKKKTEAHLFLIQFLLFSDQLVNILESSQS